MSLTDKVQDEMAKLDKLCRENKLNFVFEKDQLPIKLITMPLVDKAKGQEPLFEASEISSDEPHTDPDARIEFIFVDGDIMVRTSKDFLIGDDVLNKIKASAKKLHYLFLQWFFGNVTCCEPQEDDENLPSSPALNTPDPFAVEYEAAS